MVLALAGAFVLLIAGIEAYQRRQRRKNTDAMKRRAAR